MLRKITSAVCIAALALNFASCGGNENASGALSGEMVDDYYKFNQSGKLTVSWMEAGNVVDTQNTPVLKKAAELTNITLENVLSSSTTDQNQALSLMMASGKLPDILHTNGRGVFLQYARDGALIPLDDLIDQHAPNFKKFLQDNPKVKTLLPATDGKIYYIPSIPDGEVSFGWFIRQDWLDNLGLPMPTTVDEYYNTLKAFKNDDPNGNGKNDEIPYFNRNAGVNFDTAITCMYVLWDANKGFIERDGKIVYGPLEPQFKTAVKNIAAWYKEGLIDPEIFTRGNKARDVLLGQDLGGSTYDWIGSTAQFNETLQEKVPGFKIIPMAPPSGRVYDYRGVMKDVGWAITSKCEMPVETIKYMDFWFSKTGRLLANYGIEGETYNMVNGKPVLTDLVLKGSKPALNILNDYGAQFNMGFHQDFEYEKQWLTPTAVEGMQMYIAGNYIKPPTPSYSKTYEQEKRISELMGTINTYLSEIQQQWILGTKSIDSSYDEFVATLKQMKIDEVVQINQEAYDLMLKQSAE